MIKSALDAFLDWWLAGLALLLPVSLRRRIRHSPDRLVIDVQNDGYRFWHYRNGAIEPNADWILPGADEAEKTVTRQRLHTLIDGDIAVTLAIPREQLLIKPLSLPLSAAGNLQEILGFEMDRQTPFPTDKVYFNWRELEQDKGSDRLRLELYVVLKSVLDPLLAEIRGLGLKPRAVVPAPPETGNAINLLPESQRTQPADQGGRTTRILAYTTLALLLAALYLPLLRQSSTLAEAEAKVTDLRGQAKEVQGLIKERDTLLARRRFLEEKRRARVPVIAVLNDLTTLLPDDTWLNRLMLRNKQLQLYGESSTATALIPLLEKSDNFSNAQFKSSVTKNSATGKDRFQISADLGSGGSG